MASQFLFLESDFPPRIYSVFHLCLWQELRASDVFCPQALVKRTPSSGMSSTMKESAFQSEPRVSESLVRHTSTSPADKAKVTISDGKGADEEKPKKSSLCRTVEGCREELQNQVGRGRSLSRWFISKQCSKLSSELRRWDLELFLLSPSLLISTVWT